MPQGLFSGFPKQIIREFFPQNREIHAENRDFSSALRASSSSIGGFWDFFFEESKIISVHRDGPARPFPYDTQAVWILRLSDDRTLFSGVSRVTRATKLAQMDA